MAKYKDYLSRFSFHTVPFTREIKVNDRFILDSYDQQLKHLFCTVQKRMSAALVAPAGTGKTMLLRTLVSKLPETRYKVNYIKVTNLSQRDLCRELATAVDAKPAGSYPMLVRSLQDRFSSTLEIDGTRTLLILDEAHHIRPDVLSVLNILTNFDMDSRLVVSVILSGQSPLSRMLSRDELQDVAHRMAHYATLRLLSKDEIVLYINHRCQIAGCSSSPFDSDALSTIFEIARGNLRATDYLALKSIELAHDHDSNTINSNCVIEARRMLWP